MKKMDIETESLYRMGKLDKYNEWVFSQIKDYLGNSVLEVGSGIGTYSRFLLGTNRLVLSDIEDKYVRRLKKKFKNFKNVSVEKIDLTKDDYQKLKDYNINTVVSINVLEHINSDQIAMKNMYRILPRGGRLLLILPNHPFLYGSLDKYANHFRRYNKKEITLSLKRTGFDIEKIITVNFLGAISWFLQSRVIRNNIISSKSLWLSEKIIPIARFIDKINPFPTGLNIVVVAKK